MAVEAAKDMTTHDLCIVLDTYIDCKEHSNDVDERWLASRLIAFRELAREVRNNRLGPDARTQVNAFRAAEIEKEIAEKGRQLEILQRDLRKLQPAESR